MKHGSIIPCESHANVKVRQKNIIKSSGIKKQERIYSNISTIEHKDGDENIPRYN